MVKVVSSAEFFEEVRGQSVRTYRAGGRLKIFAENMIDAGKNTPENKPHMDAYLRSVDHYCGVLEWEAEYLLSIAAALREVKAMFEAGESAVGKEEE